MSRALDFGWIGDFFQWHIIGPTSFSHFFPLLVDPKIERHEAWAPPDASQLLGQVTKHPALRASEALEGRPKYLLVMVSYGYVKYCDIWNFCVQTIVQTISNPKFPDHVQVWVLHWLQTWSPEVDTFVFLRLTLWPSLFSMGRILISVAQLGFSSPYLVGWYPHYG